MPMKQSDNQTLFVNLPEDDIEMEVKDVEDAEPSKRYPDTDRLLFIFEVPADEREGIEFDIPEHGPNTKISKSYDVRIYAGKTLGRENNRTRLFDIFVDIVGKDFKPLFEAWCSADGDIDEKLWKGLRCGITIKHNAGEGGKVYANVDEIVAIAEYTPRYIDMFLSAWEESDPDLYAEFMTEPVRKYRSKLEKKAEPKRRGSLKQDKQPDAEEALV